MKGRRSSFSCLFVIAMSAATACGGRALESGQSGSDGATVAPPDGRCALTPTLLVSASTYPVPASTSSVKVGAGGLVVNGADLYYVTYSIATGSRSMPYLAGAVLRIPAAGGAPTEIASGYDFGLPVFTATTLILERNNAWPNTDADDVVSIPLSGGSPTALVTFDANEVLISDPVTDGTFLYLATSEGARAVPLASPANEISLTTEAPNDVLPLGGHLVMTFAQGAVKSVPLPPASGDVVTLAVGLPPGPSNLAPCGTSACWLAGSTIEQINPARGPATAAVAGAAPFSGIRGFVVDGDTFFVVAASTSDNMPDTIASIPAAGGDAVVLVKTRDAGSIAVDDECVYWSNADGIFSVAKTARGPFDQ